MRQIGQICGYADGTAFVWAYATAVVSDRCLFRLFLWLCDGRSAYLPVQDRDTTASLLHLLARMNRTTCHVCSCQKYLALQFSIRLSTPDVKSHVRLLAG